MKMVTATLYLQTFYQLILIRNVFGKV